MRVQLQRSPIKGGVTLDTWSVALTTAVYNGQGAQQDVSNWTYDAAGNQLGNTGYPRLVPPSPPLTISYSQHNQTASVTDVYQHPAGMTYTGPGQAERASADWSNAQHPTDPTKPAEFGHTTYASSNLGLMSATDATGTTYCTRDPDGLPIGERTPSGTYCYVFDGQGDVIGVDEATGMYTEIYTVITDASGNFGTAFPGEPREP